MSCNQCNSNIVAAYFAYSTTTATLTIECLALGSDQDSGGTGTAHMDVHITARTWLTETEGAAQRAVKRRRQGPSGYKQNKNLNEMIIFYILSDYFSVTIAKF